MTHSWMFPSFGFHQLTILREENGIAPNGRPITKGYAEIGKIIGMVKRASSSATSPKTKFKQENHAITHEVIQKGSDIRAKPTDVIVFGDKKFVVKGVHDYIDCGHFMLYYVEERGDLQWVLD